MSEFIWETFDGIFRTIQRQDKRFVELETRVVELEKRLNERAPLREVPPLPQPTLMIERQVNETINELQEKRAA